MLKYLYEYPYHAAKDPAKGEVLFFGSRDAESGGVPMRKNVQMSVIVRLFAYIRFCKNNASRKMRKGNRDVRLLAASCGGE